ncbi:hypothetical protein K438DRAFT_1927942 [Mycena galopus ATCC 62051]|nr:hypothetical protein K438DRAFT_1927942 [Mycena galopus ATCC 62051]
MASQASAAPANHVRLPDVVRRDNNHYDPTGDCVLQVENTLFKIHKFPLVRDSPLFAQTFGLGMYGTNHLPIFVEGETADDFRAVLKYIHASPLQLQIDSITTSALPEVIALAEFSHKYEMNDWKEWAFQVLAFLLVDLRSLPVTGLSALYLLYHRVGEYPMRNRIMKRWCKVLERDDLSLVAALDSATAREDKDALAQIYCIQIRRWQDGACMFHPPSFTNGDTIGPIHIQRILSGYVSLSLSWTQLCDLDASFQYNECQGLSPEEHDSACVPYFLKRWSETIAEAEDRYPHVTQMEDRVSYVGRHLTSSADHRKCFDDFVQQFNENRRRDMHWFANHFFASDRPAITTFTKKISKARKSGVAMESEGEGGRLSKRSRIDAEDSRTDANIEADSEAQKIREWRHKLQKTFLRADEMLPKHEEMPAVDTVFKAVEGYDKMTVDYLNFSKIGKVMRHIHLLEPHRVPRDDELHFRARAKALVDKWHAILTREGKELGSHSDLDLALTQEGGGDMAVADTTLD